MNRRSLDEEFPVPNDFPDSPAFFTSESLGFYLLRRIEFQENDQFYHSTTYKAHICESIGKEESKEIYRQYKKLTQYRLRTNLCQIYDFFTQYIEILVTDKIWQDTFNFKELTEHESRDLEKTASKFVKGRISETNNELYRLFGHKLVDCDEDLSDLKFYAAIRNLITHNNARPNSQFYDRINGINRPLSLMGNGRIKLDENSVIKFYSKLDRIVFKFDHKITKSKKISSFNRLGRFSSLEDDYEFPEGF